jgi:hypothetical protein
LDFVFGRIPPRHRIANEAFGKKEDVSPYALLRDGMGKSAGMDARRFDCATAFEAGSLFQEAVARLAVE